MNNQLIEKLIKYNSETCPPFQYENPLLDINVSRALAKSFVKIFQDSSEKSNVNTNLRQSVLENIRKLCTIEPENHVQMTDDFTEIISEFYRNKLEDPLTAVDKLLDEFLIKNILECNVRSRFEYSMSPESLQALLNLNENESTNVLSKEVLHLNPRNVKYYNVVKDLWNKKLDLNEECTDNLSIKMKADIERIILEQCLKIIVNHDLDINELFKKNSFEDIVKTATISAACFQICIGTLNTLFIACNFDSRVLLFIQHFLNQITKNCLHISSLYPVHLSTTVVLLNIDFAGMSKEIKCKYVDHTMMHLKSIHRSSENDFIMMLSHFPQWFDIYFNIANTESQNLQKISNI